MTVKILVLDDIQMNLISIKAVLRSKDYQVVTTTCPDEALDLLLADDFALILSDIMMPKINGYEFVRKVRSHEKLQLVPVIFMTALEESMENSKLGYSEGAVDYLFKPLDTQILRAKVEVFTSLHKQKQEIRHQTEALIKLNEQKDQFLGIATHDIRGPLGMIKLYIDLVENGDKQPNAELTDFVQNVKPSIESMFDLINDFLDMSVIESGNISIHMSLSTY